MATTRDPEREPLLDRSQSNNANSLSLNSSETAVDQELYQIPSVENDVLPETAVVGRNLGWSSTFILIISRVIGSGIFATPGTIVRSVGSIGITLVLWVVGAIFAWFTLAVALEYGCMLPRSGGDKVYLEFTYRRPRYLATVIITVYSVLLGFTASNCIVFAEYVVFAVKGTAATRLETKLLAAGLLTTVIMIHSCFLRAGIYIQNTIGWVKIGLIIVMVFASFLAVFVQDGTALSGSTYPPKMELGHHSIWAGSNWNWGIMSTAFFKVWYSYNGLQNVNNVLNEVKDPVRTLRSAASFALLTACLLYLMVNVAYFLVVPIDEIKDSGELIAALFFERLFGARVGQVVLPLAVAISALGNVMVVTFSHARMIQEIARQGFLPFGKYISSTKPFNAPMGALITHYVPSLLVILLPSGNVYSFILDVEGYPAQIFALASSLGIIWLRYERPDLKRPYRAFLPAVWIRVCMSVGLLIAPFISREGLSWAEHLSQVSYCFVGISVILFAVLYWFVLTILLPRWKGYRLEEEMAVLDDGTTITKLVKADNKSVKPGSDFGT